MDYWRKTNCVDCGIKLYSRATDYGLDLCMDHSYSDEIPWGMDGVNAVIEHFDEYQKHLEGYGIYYDFTDKIEWAYFELPNWFCLWLVKFKAMVCLALNLYPNRNIKLHQHETVYLDFWGSMSGYEEPEWMERGYQVGLGVFTNWWITEA